MELRGHSDWAIFVLLIWGNVFSSIVAGFHDSNATVQSLDCTNDFIDMISCNMKAPNCTQYKLLFVEENTGMLCQHCPYNDQCCCNLNPPTTFLLIYGENHTVTVWKGGENLGSKKISIIAGIKPRVPKIHSVRNSNGIFEIAWKSDMEGHYIDSQLSASVTYFKDGETKKTSPLFTPTSQGGLKVYRIPSRDLEPSASYRVCVRSYIEWSGRYSSCSAEEVFITPMSRSTLALVLILSLSVAAVVISSVAFVCFVKIKTLWWDTAPKPKLLLLNLSEQKVLNPALSVLSLVQVEIHKGCLLGSGITAGDRPSAFTSLSPESTRLPQRLSDSSLCSSPSIRADGGTFGSRSFDNKSYFSILPRFPEQEERSEVKTQGGLICDPTYRGSDGDSDGQQLLEHLLLTSASLPLMDTDTCYQVSRVDLVQVPSAGDSRRSSLSSRSSTSCDSSSGVGLKTNRDAAKIDNSGKTDIFLEAILLDGGAPAGSNSFLPVDFTYQTFQSLVEPSDALALEEEEQLRGHPDGPLTATSEDVSHLVRSCYPDDDVSGSSASPTFQKSFFSLISADQSTPTIMVDSDYKSVVNADAWSCSLNVLKC